MKLKKLVQKQLTAEQRRLLKKHGTPAEFSRACYDCVPGWISMDEAAKAVQDYNREWNAAK